MDNKSIANPKTAEEYDQIVAEGVKKRLQKICQKYDIGIFLIEELFILLKKAGCRGMEKKELKTIIDERLKIYFDELIEELDKNFAGIAVHKTGSPEKDRAILERYGRIYLDVYCK